MKFEIYKDSAGEYRWKLKARNGKILAVSSEGYKKKQTMLRIIESIKRAVIAEKETD